MSPSAETMDTAADLLPPKSDKPSPGVRPGVQGPFLFVGNEKFVVKGVTYGSFAPNEAGQLFPSREQVREDFAQMREANVNTVRTYTPPPGWLMEEARSAGLRVLLGIYWDCGNCNFDDVDALREAEESVRSAVRDAVSYPDVVLAYVIANEVPSLVARFHGRRTIERKLERLYQVAKEEDPGGLVTYGNFPPTEFLQLEFLDFHLLNVYLLEKETLSAYLDRMLIQSQGKPLVLGEIGDDSIQRGEDWQAELLDWTIPLALDKGVGGVCVFSWTDDWVVGGHRVEDWAFGLVATDRSPKQALEVVRRRYGDSPYAWRDVPWPRVSVVVCNYNGGDTLEETLVSLEHLTYPRYEIILVDDGSTDASREIAGRHEDRVKVILQRNKGLSVARNVGAEAAEGEIVAYIDSDALADPDWLRYLVLAMESGDFVGAGGPNLTPPTDGLNAQFIGLCPGNPTYILRDNVHADHIAGVNMAFLREALLSIGGFDPVHTRAGDDVDICWRLEDSKMRLAFSPAAIVWHHRRPSVWRFLRQQFGYGEAENQLERKHPERFNLGGYIRWSGRVYQAPHRVLGLFKPFIYHGHLGTAMFQTLYQKDPSFLTDAPRLAQWNITAALSLLLTPLSWWFGAFGLVLLGISVWVALLSGVTTEAPMRLSRKQKVRKICIVAFLHFMYPLVRWGGRVQARLRKAMDFRFNSLTIPPPRKLAREVRHLLSDEKDLRRYWGPGVADRERLLLSIQQGLKRKRLGASVCTEWDNHDLHVNSTFAAEGRLHSAPENYDQSLCFGLKVRTTTIASVSTLFLLALAGLGILLDAGVILSLLLPVTFITIVLAQRTRLRNRVWRAIDNVMKKEDARKF